MGFSPFSNAGDSYSFPLLRAGLLDSLEKYEKY
jgi:hypothetical protein